MSNSFPPGLFRQAKNLRLREVLEWGCLLIYTPDRPNIHYLDARSWLIFELCDGRAYESLLAEFGEAVPEGTGAEQIQQALDSGLESLVRNGLVVRTGTIDVVSDRVDVAAGVG